MPLAAVVYSAMGAVALLWGWIQDRPIFWDPARSSWLSAGLGLIAGASLGGVIALATDLALPASRAMQELADFFTSVLGPIGWREAFGLALLSSFGEEMFFRGAMQPDLGLGLTTLLFGLAHLPPRARLLTWTLLATLFGLLIGLLAEHTGNLAGPIAAHFTINFLNLKLYGEVAAGK